MTEGNALRMTKGNVLRMIEGNHEHTSQRCIGTQPGKKESRSIGSARHALEWTQTHSCASRMDSSGHPAHSALYSHAPGILYTSADGLHRRYMCYLATNPWLRTGHPEAWLLSRCLCDLHPRAYHRRSNSLLSRRCRDFLAQI